MFRQYEFPSPFSLTQFNGRPGSRKSESGLCYSPLGTEPRDLKPRFSGSEETSRDMTFLYVSDCD
jgi:hypothetical protein